MIDIIIFLFTCIGLGFIIDFFYDWKPDLIKGMIIRLGVGLGVYPILGVLLKTVGLQLDWVRFLLIAVVIVMLNIILKFRRYGWMRGTKYLFNFKKIKWQPLIILALVGVSMFMYIGGSYKYPWFEDSDPWEFAESSKYIGETGTYSAPFYFNHFAEPYTQGYQIIMGTIYQINGSIYDTMKIFHNLIISFGVIFFFYFVLRLSNNYRIALLSSIFLWAIPAFFSHFIFALTFNITIMFVFFYAFLRKWKFVASLLFASLLVTHFYTAIIATVFMMIMVVSRVIVNKKFPKSYIKIGFFGALLSLAFWIPAYFKYKAFDLMEAVPPVGGIEMFFPHLVTLGIIAILCIWLYFTRNIWFVYIIKMLKYKTTLYFIILFLILGILVIPAPSSIIYVGGSGDRTYGFGDFFIAKGQGLFNNPIGIGIVVMSLFCIGLIFIAFNFNKLLNKGNLCLFTSFNLAIFSLIGVFGKSLSIGFIPFRMWTFFAIPCAIIAGIALSKICETFTDKIFTNYSYPIKSAGSILLILLVCGGVYVTSFQQKYELNTSIWPEHKIYVPGAIQLYPDAGLPKGTSLTGLCHPTYVASSYDYKIEPWISEELAFYHKIAMNQSVEENNAIYKKYNISYVIVDVGCYSKFNYPPEMLNQKVRGMAESGLFESVKVLDNAVLFRVI